MRKWNKRAQFSIIFSLMFLFHMVFPYSIIGAEGKLSFNDLRGHWAESQINDWIDQGLVNGYPDGTFKPNHLITRAEFMVLVNRAFDYEKKGNIQYSDVLPSDWYASEVAIAQEAGYISGYNDGTMRPKNPISRQEAAVVLAKIGKLDMEANLQAIEQFADRASIPAWSKGAVAAVVSKSYMKGYPDNTYQPAKPITRAEAIVTLNYAMKDQPKVVSQTYDKSGTYGPAEGAETIEGNVQVTAKDITLQNIVITGNLVLTEGIGEGDVTLKQVAVKGTTTILGGGPNSIKIENSELNQVTVDKKNGNVRILASGKTSVGEVTLQSGAKLEEKDLKDSTGFAKVILSETIKADSLVTLVGNFDRVEINSNKTKVKVESGTITELLVTDKAKEMTIDVAEAAIIKTLTLDAATKMTGKGKIELANINVNGTTLEQEPVKVVKPDGVTYEIKKPALGGGGGGGGISIDYNAQRIADLNAGKNVVGDIVLSGDGKTYGPAGALPTVKGKITIKGEGITLQNVVIDGDLVVEKKTASGQDLEEFTALNVEVKGNTQVNGGSSNTVGFKGKSKMNTVVVNHAGVGLALEGETSVATLDLESDVKLKLNTSSGIGTVNILQEISFFVEGIDGAAGGTIGSLNVTRASNLTFNIPSGSGSVGIENMDIKIESSSSQSFTIGGTGGTLNKITVNSAVSISILNDTVVVTQTIEVKVNGVVVESVNSSITQKIVPASDDIKVEKKLVSSWKVLDAFPGDRYTYQFSVTLNAEDTELKNAAYYQVYPASGDYHVGTIKSKNQSLSTLKEVFKNPQDLKIRFFDMNQYPLGEWKLKGQTNGTSGKIEK
ncbi:S-layer homology domain-containing protein [Ammoniphilus sp. CFH 90114]|uniref:S-layer homology domain-containing protein n=1 Tax=Ammoniphilus sp. CFH 90114 TaxID=2493665 RepID=UPI00100E78F1|nr:S-layer homology domain-containing protein [Ammoniphilus sp. CFH 90114]RXT04526.1 hypothetical protein EIZ39_20125 [Ammoniphilus sp. CFH 90114]